MNFLGSKNAGECCVKLRIVAFVSYLAIVRNCPVFDTCFRCIALIIVEVRYGTSAHRTIMSIEIELVTHPNLINWSEKMSVRWCV